MNAPVAIGGLGGSGTRVFAELFISHGYYFGFDLNEARDNLSYTLLFKRLSTILESDEKFRKLCDIFFSAMQGNFYSAMDNKELLYFLAETERMGHSREWLLKRAENLTNKPAGKIRELWGWKEPNTHILIDRFLRVNDDLKYIHVLRNPLYMAFSRNINQLRNWGCVVLDGSLELTSNNALRFWISTLERILSLLPTWPNRILILRYEDMIENPLSIIAIIERFLGIAFDDTSIRQITSLVARGANSGNPLKDLDAFLPEVNIRHALQLWRDQSHDNKLA